MLNGHCLYACLLWDIVWILHVYTVYAALRLTVAEPSHVFGPMLHSMEMHTGIKALLPYT